MKNLATLAFCLTFLLPKPLVANITIFPTQPVHDYSLKQGPFTLRSPADKQEWIAYHHIRHNEVHRRYFLGFAYDFNEPDESKENNFRFVLIKEGTITGQVRIDVDKDVCRLHWLGIDGRHQKQGHGSMLVQLSERFSRNYTSCKNLEVTVPESVKRFYLKNGFNVIDKPHEANLSMMKELAS